MRRLAISVLAFVFFVAISAQAQSAEGGSASGGEASAAEPDEAVYRTVVQLCQATDPGCVSVHRNDETVLVTRGQDIVLRMPIQGPVPEAPPEPAVKVRITGEDAMGVTTVIVTASGTEYGPYRLEQGHAVAVSPDGNHFALLQKSGKTWSLVMDGVSYPLQKITLAAGVRFVDDSKVAIDTVEGTTLKTVEVQLAAASL